MLTSYTIAPYGRGSRIWTCDISVPSRVTYQTSPYPDIGASSGTWTHNANLEGWSVTNYTIPAHHVNLKYCCSTNIHFITSFIKLEPPEGIEPPTCWLQISCHTVRPWRLISRHLFLVLPITPQFIRTDRIRTYIFFVIKKLRIHLLIVSFIVTLNQLLVTHLGLEPRTHRLKACYSPNWVSGSYMVPNLGFEPRLTSS